MRNLHKTVIQPPPLMAYHAPMTSALYHQQNPAQRAHFYDRAAVAVRQKACNLYRLNPENLNIPSGVQRVVNEQCDAWLTSKYWRDRRDTEMRKSGLATTETATIERTARIVLQLYLEGFYLRQRLSHQSTRNAHYPEPATRVSMADLYISHRTNQAEALLEESGLSQTTAHALNTTLIGLSIQAYQTYDSNEAISYVVPALGTARDKTPEQIAARIDELRRFAQNVPQTTLQANYRSVCGTAHPRSASSGTSPS